MIKYDQNVIKNVQKNQNYILKEFANFCKINNIKYTLDYGTMLGSIRHGGFIPWDDDIDVAMLRNDYDLFMKLAGAHLNDNLFIQTYETDPEFVHSFARIRLNDSLALQEDWKNLDCHHGIFMDIFPYDTMPENRDDQIRHEYLIYVIQEAKLHRVKMKDPDFRKNNTNLKENTLSQLSLQALNSYQTTVITKYNNNFSNDDRVTHMTQGFKSYDEFQRTVFEHENTINAQFEENTYPIPKSYDTILSRVYGNYLEYPPKKLRKPHHGVIKYVTRDLEHHKL